MTYFFFYYFDVVFAAFFVFAAARDLVSFLSIGGRVGAPLSS